MAKANTYLFLTQSTYLLIPGAIDYFYTALPPAGCAADAKCAASGCYVNDGPHFSSTYYLTVSQILASLAGYVGVTLFQTFLSTVSDETLRSCGRGTATDSGGLALARSTGATSSPTVS